jgi:hypothetical protein
LHWSAAWPENRITLCALRTPETDAKVSLGIVPSHQAGIGILAIVVAAMMVYFLLRATRRVIPR